MATEGKTKAPAVDAKRLASLEASAASLALALQANGIELEEGQAPIVQAIVIVKRWRELTIARAELILAVALATGTEPETIEDPFAAAAGALETMKDRIASLEAQLTSPEFSSQANAGAVAVLEEQLEASRKRVAELELENAELQHDVEDLANARNVLANKLADEGKSANEPPAPIVVEEQPAPAALVRPELARDVGPTFGKLSIDELKTLASENAPLEVVFSNGEFEIIEFSTPEIRINGSDLQLLDGYRHVITPAIHIKGGTMPERIAGVGLMFDGVQVAYHAFTAPLEIQPGADWKFERQIAF